MVRSRFREVAGATASGNPAAATGSAAVAATRSAEGEAATSSATGSAGSGLCAGEAEVGDGDPPPGVAVEALLASSALRGGDDCGVLLDDVEHDAARSHSS